MFWIYFPLRLRSVFIYCFKAVLDTSFSTELELTFSASYFNFLPKIDVQSVVNTTILMELNGIKIAAITGANCPVMAKYKPILL